MSEPRKMEENYQFQAEIPQLIDIIAKSMYQHREIFLRELISNAADALNKVRFEQIINKEIDSSIPLEIKIEVDEKERTLTVSDTGIGMTKQELIENLGTIAKSGTLEFIEKLKKEGHDEKSIIGHFGVGFYSVFMVADEVIVRTKSYKEDNAWEWISQGGPSFKISPIDKEQRGTEVILKLKKDAKEFLEEEKIKELVKKYSDFIEFPIYFKGEIINERTPLWRKPKNEIKPEDYESFYRTLVGVMSTPMMHLHFVTETPIPIKAIIYVPSKRPLLIGMPEEWGLKLYSRNVLISPKFKELLPRWLWFLQGVVDAEDIPLNISRETIQIDRVVIKIKKVLLKRILKWFKEVSEKQPEKYAEFWKEFGLFIKDGYIEDHTNRNKIVDLLRFKSRKHPDEYISLRQYVEEMPEDQDMIYYVIAETDNAAANSPHLESINENWDVLFFTESIDSFLVLHLTEYEGKHLQNVESVEDTQEEELNEKIRPLIEITKKVLGPLIAEVKGTTKLKNSPARLKSQAPLLTAMQRAMSYLNETPSYDLMPNVLEYNVNHPLILKMNEKAKQNPDDDLLIYSIKLLHSSLQRVAGADNDPIDVLNYTKNVLELAFLGKITTSETTEENESETQVNNTVKKNNRIINNTEQ